MFIPSHCRPNENSCVNKTIKLGVQRKFSFINKGIVIGLWSLGIII